MAGKQKSEELFRKKSLEMVQSPDSLNDYLKVTSPGVWLVLSAVIAVLIGVLIWGIFGRIETVRKVAVISENNTCYCLVSYDDLNAVAGLTSVSINGKAYQLHPDMNVTPEVISGDENPYELEVGNLETGDVVIRVSVDCDLPESIYAGTIVTESIRPIDLLLE